MTRARSCDFFNLLHFAFISSTLIAELSSIKMGSSVSRLAESVKRSHSLSLKNPVLNLVASILASNPNILMPSCCLDISREKTATAFPVLFAALYPILRARAVFPILGLPAIMIRSEGCRPAVNRSKALKSVGTPVTNPSEAEVLSSFLKLSLITCPRLSRPSLT